MRVGQDATNGKGPPSRRASIVGKPEGRACAVSDGAMEGRALDTEKPRQLDLLNSRNCVFQIADARKALAPGFLWVMRSEEGDLDGPT